MNTDERIQVPFTITDENGVTYTDAMYFTPQERADITDEQLESMKMERFSNWKASIAAAQNAPQADPVDVLIDIDTQIEELMRQRELRANEIVAEKDINPEALETLLEEKRTEREQNEQAGV